MLPPPLRRRLEELASGPIGNVRAVGGGCIANAAQLQRRGDACFLKWGHPPVGETFVAEAAGLELLRSVRSPLKTPAVIAVEAPSGDCPGFLLLEWIEAGAKSPAFWQTFGISLAQLHRFEGPGYGATFDNYIGQLPQENSWVEGWPDFFRERRLGVQVGMAQRKGVWRREWSAPLERLYTRLDELLPQAPERSVLHGDLWSGNFMADRSGSAVLIDPAAYHGHRETDLAMTELFGGFDPQFYAAYREAWPLEAGYEERREVYNLYHLLNHLNHFGSSYTSAVDAALTAFH